MKTIYFFLSILTCCSHGLFAATITAVQNGSWSTNSTWDLNRNPTNNDVVVIPVGIIVYVQNTPIAKTPAASRPTLVLKIHGTLDFSNPGNDKLYLDAGSTIDIFSGAKIQTTGSSTETIAIYNGTSDNLVWDGTPTTINGAAHADEFTAGFIFGVLPLNLISFEVVAMGHASGKLSWTTSEESKTSHFEIETFEPKNRVWVKKGSVKAAGNSFSVLHYNFIVQLESGTNQFRLKEVDTDGRFTYSSIISINNSVTDQTRLYYSSRTHSIQFEGLDQYATNKITIELFDFNGRHVLKQQVALAHSPVYFSPPVKGGYIVCLKGTEGVLLTKKIMVY